MIRNLSLTKTRGNGSQADLLRAFEAARTQLAVAIAAEAKSTTLKRRQYYLDMADRMRQFTKRLRAADGISPPLTREWQRVLENIRQLPVEGRALRLCRIFNEILADGE